MRRSVLPRTSPRDILARMAKPRRATATFILSGQSRAAVPAPWRARWNIEIQFRVFKLSCRLGSSLNRRGDPLHIEGLVPASMIFSTAAPRSTGPAPTPGRCGFAAQPREALRRLRHPFAGPPPIFRTGSLRSGSETPRPRPTMSPNPLAIDRSVLGLTRLNWRLLSHLLSGVAVESENII